MHKKLYYISAGCLLALSVMSCNHDTVTIPVSINQSSLVAEPAPGQVTLRWDVPANADYHYVKVNYTIPETGETFMKSASIYTNEIVIPNLLARYGVIDFVVNTVSKDGGEGKPCHISAQCDPVEPALSFTPAGDLSLSADGIWGDIGEYTEGPIADLIDGNTNTFYHTCWSGYIVTYDGSDYQWYEDILPADRIDWWAPPTYIVVKLPKQISAFTFSIVNRNNGNKSNPGTIELYTSDSFDPSVFSNFDETVWNARYIGTASGLPADQAASYTSDLFYDIYEPLGNYLWFKVTEITRSDIDYIALAELSIREYSMAVYDAENDYDN